MSEQEQEFDPINETFKIARETLAQRAKTRRRFLLDRTGKNPYGPTRQELADEYAAEHWRAVLEGHEPSARQLWGRADRWASYENRRALGRSVLTNYHKDQNERIAKLLGGEVIRAKCLEIPETSEQYLAISYSGRNNGGVTDGKIFDVTALFKEARLEVARIALDPRFSSLDLRGPYPQIHDQWDISLFSLQPAQKAVQPKVELSIVQTT